MDRIHGVLLDPDKNIILGQGYFVIKETTEHEGEIKSWSGECEVAPGHRLDAHQRSCRVKLDDGRSGKLRIFVTNQELISSDMIFSFVGEGPLKCSEVK